MGLDKSAAIDAENQRSLNNLASKWRNILCRILDCIYYLSIQNLAFRGHREVLSATENPGNLLELVKFLGNYDPVVREHLTRLQGEPNTVSYLSPAIHNEFISILGQHVLENIIEEVQEAKYYSITFDSTPDLAHDDQMSQVLRYVKIFGGNVELKETFLCYIKCEKKGAEALTNLISAKLKEDNCMSRACGDKGTTTQLPWPVSSAEFLT